MFVGSNLMYTLCVFSSFFGFWSSSFSLVDILSKDDSLFFRCLSSCPSIVVSGARMWFLTFVVFRCGNVVRNPDLMAFNKVALHGENSAPCRKRVSLFDVVFGII